MTLDNHDLQRLVALYRQVAHANAEIASLYAGRMERAPQAGSKPSPAKSKAKVSAPKPVPALAEAAQLVEVSVQTAPADDPNKPPAQRVAVAGFDMSKIGMTKGGSAIQWETLIGHPPFHMFMSEQGFPNPDGKDAAELAVDFIIEQSKSKPELVFYAEYAKWFKDKGFWPNETPFGGPVQKS